MQANPERIEGAVVSPSLFAILGVQARLGRVFTSEEAQPDRDNVLLLSYGLWQRRFGSDPDIIGRTLVANSKPYVIVGVLPPGFDYPNQAEIRKPEQVRAFYHDLLNRIEHLPGVIAAGGSTFCHSVGETLRELSRWTATPFRPTKPLPRPTGDPSRRDILKRWVSRSSLVAILMTGIPTLRFP